jgi:hypothetical protein
LSTVFIEAAVPKKKQSKRATNTRYAHWKAKVNPQAVKALFLAKLAMKEGSANSADKDFRPVPAAAAAEEPTADAQ